MNEIIIKLWRAFTDKKICFSYMSRFGFFNRMSDEKYLECKFKLCMKKKLDLENPKTYNEKLQWLKLYDRRDDYTIMVDKYLVRDYVVEKLDDKYLIPLLGVWNDPNEIEFDKLPNQFVLKCNHNSGTGMCICKDKSQLDIIKVKGELKKGLKENYYLTGREWPYKNVQRRIICEKYIQDTATKTLKDYKFYCFDGVMRFVMINSDRNSDRKTKADYFDRNFNWLDFAWGYDHAEVPPSKPIKFDEMIEIAEKLSKGIPHVRIDLYECDEKVYFGEMTFFDASGFDRIEPEEWDYKIGDMLVLPPKKENL